MILPTRLILLASLTSATVSVVTVTRVFGQTAPPCSLTRLSVAFDDNGDNVMDKYDHITVANDTGQWNGELRIYTLQPGVPTRVIFSGQPGFGARAVPIGDIDGDGHADFAVSAPFNPTASGLGTIDIISGSSGTELYELAGPANCMYGTELVVVRDINGDGRPDLAVAFMYVTDSGAAVQQWCVLSGTTFAALQTLPQAFKCGDLADLDNDGKIDDQDLLKAIQSTEDTFTEADKGIADVNKDGVIDANDVAEVAWKVGMPVQLGYVSGGPADAVALPVKPQQLYNLAVLGGYSTIRDSFCTSSGVWRADTNVCQPGTTPATTTVALPCSGVGCLWNGGISFDYWVALLGGLGSLQVTALAVDTTGCTYAVGGTAPLSCGGGLAVGYVSAGLSISSYSAPCQWPVNDGDWASGALAGVGGTCIGLPSGLWWPAATAGAFSGLISPYPWGGGGVSVGAGGSAAGGHFPTGSVKHAGPTPPPPPPPPATPAPTTCP